MKGDREGPRPDPSDHEALERSLADLERPAVRNSFRSALREAFLGGFAGAGQSAAERAEGRVSKTFENPGDGASRTPEAGRREAAGGLDMLPHPVEDQLRSLPLAPPARPEFRENLRAEFTTGRLASAPRAAGPPPMARHRGFRFLLGGAALAAAAAVLVILAGPGLDSGGDGGTSDGSVFDGGWRVTTAATGSGLVRVDGHEYSLGDRARIEAAWNAGQRLEATDVALELAHPDGLRLALQPGTLTRLSEDLESAASPAWSLDLERGEVLLATVDDYSGRPVSFVTLDSSVLVTGTALSVMCGKQGTCVCVEHGSVVVRCLIAGKLMQVGDEETCFVYRDGVDEPFEGPFCEAAKEFGEDMRAEHIDPLRSFCH